jgi:hypothetical protein
MYSGSIFKTSRIYAFELMFTLPPYQGKFIAIRDGTNLTEIFGEGETPWEKRFKHSMSLPFYQAHPDQLERIEDNFDYFYRNLLGRKIR